MSFSARPHHLLPPARPRAAPRILAADGQQRILEEIQSLLRPQGYNVDVVRSPERAREALVNTQYDAALIDLNYLRDSPPGKRGANLLPEIVAQDGAVPIIVLTPRSSLGLALEAMRRGARDFIQKPWEDQRLLLSVLRTQVELFRALQEAERRAAENRMLQDRDRPALIANSPSMISVLESVARIAPSEANVLITGEHGTGKKVIARSLHALSLRSSGPFIPVDIGGFPDDVFERDFFGYVKGGFSGRDAKRIGHYDLGDNGTLFLNGISGLTSRQQAKLFRRIETGEGETSRARKANVRIISSTDVDLKASCWNGQFHEHLLLRLRGAQVHLPALRDRKEDIPALATHFLKLFNSLYRRHLVGISPSAMQLLVQHAWPGNIRELAHMIERAVQSCRTEQLQSADLGLASQRPQPQGLEVLSLMDVESVLIRKTLQRFCGDVILAADALGLSSGALRRRMTRYDL